MEELQPPGAENDDAPKSALDYATFEHFMLRLVEKDKYEISR